MGLSVRVPQCQFASVPVCSEMMLLLLSCILVLCLLLLLLQGDRRFHLLPSPGPCLPLLGHFHLLIANKGTADPVNRLWSLYKKHNKSGLLRIRVLNLELVYIGDLKTLKEVYNHPDVQGRLLPQMFEIIQENRGVQASSLIPGVVLSEGKGWVEQRRFTLKALKDFGFGKTSMEVIIADEIVKFQDLLKSLQGQPVDLRAQFNLPIINILWRVVAGDQFDYGNPKLTSLLANLTLLFQHSSSPKQQLTMAYPWMNKIGLLRRLLKRERNMKIMHRLMQMMRTSIEEHEQNLDIDHPCDFIDMVLREIRQATDQTSSFYGETGKENLAVTLFDLFVAGSETSSTTLSWALLYMVKNPNVQAKVQSELEQVVGRNRSPSLQDRPCLPYTEATLMEVQRMANIGPTGVPHVTTKDVNVNGFTLPANTMVFGLFTEILKGSQWKDGTNFRPERFLNPGGGICKDPHFIPFSIGKRQCLGETLAKAELFLFFCALLHKFTFQPEWKGAEPTEEYCPGLTILPRPFKVILKARD